MGSNETDQMAATDPIRLNGNNQRVEVTPGDDETVSVRIGGESDGITLVGTRYEVHQMIIEADRQLGRLTPRFPGV